jgi:hypothetical protein
MTEWQPISTAPKDEDIYILACREGSKIPGILGWDQDEGWYWFNGMFRDTTIPTHWMPLPEPPKV